MSLPQNGIAARSQAELKETHCSFGIVIGLPMQIHQEVHKQKQEPPSRDSSHKRENGKVGHQESVEAFGRKDSEDSVQVAIVKLVGSLQIDPLEGKH